MPRALSSLAVMILLLPACAAEDFAPEPEGAGGGGSGGAVDSSMGGETDAQTAGSQDESGGDGSGGAGHGGSGEGSAGGDDGSSSGGAETVCGNGLIEEGEFCDDGGDADGDGCESDCTQTVGVQHFATGGAHTCAADFRGEVRCFGDNSYGQLGIGSTESIGDDETPFDAGLSVALPAPARQLAAGAHHTCAVTNGGDVYCWGRNDHGQLGYGHTEAWGDDQDETPASAGAVDLDVAVVAVTAGERHTCALMADGDVRCWGDGELGQLGLGSGFTGTVGAGEQPYPEARSVPPIDLGRDVYARSLSVGQSNHSCAVDQQGTARCWGSGKDGQIGNASAGAVGVDETPAEAGVALLDDPMRRSFVGGSHTCTRSVNGQLACFGLNDSGQLGYGESQSYGDDEPPLDAYVHLGGLSVLMAALTDSSTCALLEDATVRCWGAAGEGRLGYASDEAIGDDEVPSASEAFGAIKLTAAATGLAAGADHVCARTADARLRCWGAGASGRLGSGSEKNIGEDEDLPSIPALRIFR